MTTTEKIRARIAEINATNKNTLPGRWSYDEDEDEIHADDWANEDGEPAHICELLGPQKRRESTANAIIAAHTDIPLMAEALSDAINALEKYKFISAYGNTTQYSDAAAALEKIAEILI